MQKTSLVVAALQLCSQADVGQNSNAACARPARAGSRAEVVLLPENFAFFRPEADKRGLAESLVDGPSPTRSAKWRGENAVTVIAVAFQSGARMPSPPNTLLSPRWLALGQLPQAAFVRRSSWVAPAATPNQLPPLRDSSVVGSSRGFQVRPVHLLRLRFPELYRPSAIRAPKYCSCRPRSRSTRQRSLACAASGARHRSASVRGPAAQQACIQAIEHLRAFVVVDPWEP